MDLLLYHAAIGKGGLRSCTGLRRPVPGAPRDCQMVTSWLSRIAPIRQASVGTGAGTVGGCGDAADHAGQEEARVFGNRGPSDVDHLYLWVDGVHLGVRPKEENPADLS